MANTQFSGPVYSNNGFRIGSYYNSSPGTAGNNTNNSPIANVSASQTQTLSVTASAAKAQLAVTVPTGARITGIIVYTTTAFGAATDVTIALGNVSTADAAQYVAATSIKAAGVYPLTLAATAVAGLLSFPGTLYLTIAQTGALSATGAATLAIQYAV
jgi:hypothetical protein